MSLKKSGTNKQLAIMITDNVSTPMRDVLSQVFNHVELVNILDSNDLVNLSLLERPDLGVTFTKLHCWRLVQYSKCVFMDADTLVLQNIDELFEREELSAAPDPGWPDCFNSGVFVFQPKLETYIDLLRFAIEKGSFDGGDQGLLNMFFSDWSTKDIKKHLPFVFNCVNQASNSYLPAYTHFRSQIKVLHFLGPVFDSSTGDVKDGSGPNDESQQIWRSMFITHVEPLISKKMRYTPLPDADERNEKHVELLPGRLPGDPTAQFFMFSNQYREQDIPDLKGPLKPKKVDNQSSSIDENGLRAAFNVITNKESQQQKATTSSKGIETKVNTNDTSFSKIFSKSFSSCAENKFLEEFPTLPNLSTSNIGTSKSSQCSQGQTINKNPSVWRDNCKEVAGLNLNTNLVNKFNVKVIPVKDKKKGKRIPHIADESLQRDPNINTENENSNEPQISHLERIKNSMPTPAFSLMDIAMTISKKTYSPFFDEDPRNENLLDQIHNNMDSNIKSRFLELLNQYKSRQISAPEYLKSIQSREFFEYIPFVSIIIPKICTLIPDISLQRSLLNNMPRLWAKNLRICITCEQVIEVTDIQWHNDSAHEQTEGGL